MSGSVKLKIKLKPRPAETAPSRESSGLKRKLEDDGKDTPRDTAHKAHNNREPHKSKKLKLAQKNPSTPAAAPSSNKVKLHIKGPWGKATNGTGNTESPQNSSAPAAQPSLSQQKPLPFTAFRPPAKQVPNTGGQLQSAKAPGSKKRQHSSIAPSVQPHIGSQTNGVTGLIKHGTQSLDTKSEDTNMDSISGRPGTTLGHAIKAEEATTSGAVTHPTTLVLVRIVDKMQRKDTFNIFKEPVTEAMAPGYFLVVKRGMDFSTMRSKVQANEYDIWQTFQDDMDVMFDNAMAYNQPDTVYHKQARSLKAVAAKMIDLAKQGVTDFRGKTMQESKAHNAQIAAEEQAHREARRLEQRSAMAASRAADTSAKYFDGVLASDGSLLAQPKPAPRVHRPVVRESDMRKFATQEENNRATYWQNPTAQSYSRWKGLSAGATAEGVSFQSGRPILRAAVLMGKDTYAASIARFTAGLHHKFRQLAKSRIAAFTFPEGHSYSQMTPLAQPSVQQPAASLAGSTATLPYSAPTHTHLPQALSGSGPGRPAVAPALSGSVPGLNVLSAHNAALQAHPARTPFSSVQS